MGAAIAWVLELVVSLFWVLPFLAAIFLIPSFVTNNSRHYGMSSFFMIISAVLAGIYFWDDISPIITDHGKTFSIAFLAGSYIVAGLATSFVYWIFYNWKAKERFERLVDEERLPRWAADATADIQLALRKYLVINNTSSRREIFDDYEGVLNINVPSVRAVPGENLNLLTLSDLENAIAEVLPPRFKTCKYFIVGASCSWPITLVWLLVSRVVKQLIERFISLFGGTFDRLSRFAFGKF